MSNETPGTEEGVRAEMNPDVDWKALSVTSSKDASTPYSFIEVERDERVRKLKNKGLWAYLPNNRWRDHQICLRPQGHGYIAVLRQQWAEEIRQKLQLKKKDDMPAGGQIELSRRLVLATIVGYRGGFSVGGEQINLDGKNAAEVRAFFGRYYLRPIDLRIHDREEAYDDFDKEFLDLVLETHDRLDGANYDEIDEKKEDFVLGQSRMDDYGG